MGSKRFRSWNLVIVSVIMISLLAQPNPAKAMSCAFKNPLIDRGQDPSVVYHQGYYYLVQSDAGSLFIKKSALLTELGRAPNNTIFTPPPGKPYSADLWAPELVYLKDHWYVYFAADDSPGHNAAHRIYALQADSPDPLGTWTFKGKIADATTDKWAIDANVFEYKGHLYMVWSGWPGDQGDFPQNLYIAPMSDPLTISGPRVQIATPDQPWEKSVQPIEEGPEAFIHNDHLSIVYSADASWTSAYKLGLLRLAGDNPLEMAAWTKVGPVFQKVDNKDGAVYGPGHNSMPVTSPDGTQNWLVYHAKTKAADGWKDREIKAQPFAWNADDTPNFGDPVPDSVALPLPSGQSCGSVSNWSLENSLTDGQKNTATVNGSPTWINGPKGTGSHALHFNGTGDYLDLNDPLINTMGSYSVSAWVQLDRTDDTFTIASQEGGVSSEFVLEYSAAVGGKFAFTLFDWKGTVTKQAVSTIMPVAGTWYHVIGVRDALNKQITLYVNGQADGSTDYNADWKAAGHTIIGAARLRSQRVHYFAGALAAVRFYHGALSSAEARSEYDLSH